MEMPTAEKGRSQLQDAVARCRAGLALVAGFSLGVNLLMLTLPLYMLQLFDRVIGGRSAETLLYLTLIAGAALLALGVLEAVRGRVMGTLGAWLEGRLGAPLLIASIRAGASVQPLRDLATLRGFLTGSAVFPIMDAPWTPLFIAVIFLLHPLLGWASLAGAVLLFALAVTNDLSQRRPTAGAQAFIVAGLREGDAAVRNADVVLAMGMAGNLAKRWEGTTGQALDHLVRAGNRGGALSALSKFLRLALQIGMLGAGAGLILQGELTPGGMIAGSVLLGRALAPVDQAIGSWKLAIAARAAYGRIRQSLAAAETGPGMPLPRPQGALTAEGLAYVHPGAGEPMLRGVDFRLAPGESLGVIGPSASGKTTLARLLVGNIRPGAGHLRLDGADLWRWDGDALGAHLGYLPQDVELFDATVRENIARMGDGDADAVIAAAKRAGAHEMIIKLPQGYDTVIGEGGAVLSGGQRQRVALARVLYGAPSLVVLDEPNANLDLPGEAALIDTLDSLKRDGVTTVVIAHRPSILRHVDQVLVLREGRPPAIGPADEILSRIAGPSAEGDPLDNEGQDHDRRDTA